MRPAGPEPRPLTAAEAQEAFEAMAAKGDQIAFRYLYSVAGMKSPTIGLVSMVSARTVPRREQ
jgi:hypothetical protein